MRPLLFLVAISLVVILGALAYPYFSNGSSALSREQAVAFVLDDVKPLESQGVQARVVQVNSVEGKWAVDVLLTRNPHSKCPAVEKRFYSLPPIGFRSESVLASCATPVSIDYREEALIASAALQPSLGSGAYGCAFLTDRLDPADATAYCPPLDSAALSSFSDGLPASTWVVQWNDGGSTRWIALSARGQLLKSA